MRTLLMSRNGAVLIGFLSVAGYFLWVEHNEHIVAYLPLILVAGCVLMPLFMHRGHGGHGTDETAERDSMQEADTRDD